MLAMIDWDDAFKNSDYIPGADRLPERWTRLAATCREGLVAQNRAQLDLAYGAGSRNRLDLLLPEAEPVGLILFVHGGYWHLLDNSYWTHLGAPALERGWAFAIPSYTLAPRARIGAITREIAAAIAFAAERVPGPIRLVGHSAGGHLVARMGCDDALLAPPCRERLQKIVAVSGIFDLRPLLQTKMNRVLRLDAVEAAAESPALRRPLAAIDIRFWVGAGERPEYLRQTRLAAETWQACSDRVGDHYEAQRHHFSVIDALARAHSPLAVEITT